MSVEVGTEVARLLAEHVGDWTAEDLLLLPPDGPHFEIVDGELVEKPVASRYHNQLGFELILQLRPFVPSAWQAGYEGGTQLPRSVRFPDVFVSTAVATRRQPIAAGAAADVVLAVEIVSPGYERVDRVVKPAEYAAAGIAHFWRLETEPDLLLQVHRLDGGAYRLTHEQGSGVLRLDEPFPLVLDLDALPR